MQVSDRKVAEVGAEPIPVRRLRADQARRVADVLRHQIHAGAFDDVLPSEQQLVSEFDASRNTVREALALLKDEGLIDRVPKVGTRVANRKFDHGLDALLGLQETLKGHGTVRNEVRAAMHITAPAAVARKLRLDPGERVVYIERLRYLADLPLSLDLTYLAPDIGTEILGHDLETNDIFVLIEQISGGPLGSADLARGDHRRCAHRSNARRPCGRGTADARTVEPPRRRATCRSGVHPDARGPNHHARQSDPQHTRMEGHLMALANQRTDIPVTIDESLCIQGCTLCVEICPLDSLAINPENGKAFMHVDECWYCGPCAARCPTGAVTVNMPYLLR